MRRFAIIATFTLLTAGPAAYAIEGCGTDMSRLGFKDKDGKDYELWKCNGGWRLSNLANEQAYVNDDGKPCVKNASTGQELCCPNVPSKDSTDTRAKQETSKDSVWKCVGSNGKPASKPEDMDTLLIAPLNKNGSYSSTVYRISGGNNAKDKDIAKDKKKSRITVEIEVPEQAGSVEDKSGSISLESPMGSGGGGDNKCASRDQGSFCQLPRDLTKHRYESTEDSKYVLQDTPSGGQSKAVTTDTTGKTAYSAR